MFLMSNHINGFVRYVKPTPKLMSYRMKFPILKTKYGTTRAKRTQKQELNMMAIWIFLLALLDGIAAATFQSLLLAFLSGAMVVLGFANLIIESMMKGDN